MRRILTAVFAAAVMLVFALDVSANDVMCYLRTGYNGNESEFFAPDSGDGIKKLSISASGYSFSGDINSHKRQMTHGILVVSADLYGSDASEQRTVGGSSALNLTYAGRGYELDDYSVVRFGVSVADNGEDSTESYHLTAAVENTDGETWNIAFDAPAGSWTLVSVDLRSAYGELAGITVSLAYDGSNVPDTFSCSAPYLDAEEDDAFVNAEKFSAEKLTASVGMVTPSSGRVRPSDGYAEISGRLLEGLSPSAGTNAYFAVKLSGITSGGMSLGLSYAGAEDEQRYHTKKIALGNSEDDDELVVFPIDVMDTLESFTLYFSDVVCGSYFRITEIGIIGGAPVPKGADYDIGTLSSLKRNGNTITFEGTMQRDAVRKFSGESIGFYAVRPESADDLSTAYLLGSVRMSTVFTYTADFSSMSGMCDTFMFFAAVRDTGSGALMPLSRPRYPDASSLPGSDVSVLGFSDAASVGVFEANVSHVSVDVDLYELLTDQGAGTTVSYTDFDSKGGTARQIYFSYAILSSLDSEIDFYISSGTRVYLRLTASDEIEGLTGGEPYMPDLSIPGAGYMWAAVVRYLADRYDGISGFVLGCGVNNAAGADAPDSVDGLVSYSASLAELVRITYNAASVKIDDMPVIVPFASGGEVNASVLAVLLSDRLSDIGTVPWVMQWHITSVGDDSEAQFAELSMLRNRLGELELALPAACTFFLTTENDAMLADYGKYAESCRALGQTIPEYSDYAAEVFGRFYEKCESYRAEAAFVSLEGHSLKHNHDFYSAIKNIGFSDNAETERSVYGTEVIAGPSDAAYNYTLFDFSDKQYPLGWIAGGGVKSCLTESSELFSSDSYTRVLRSEFSDDLGFVDNAGNTMAGTAGIILRNLSRVYDFSGIDTAEFTVAVEAASADAAESGSVTLVFVIGSDDYRAEYYASDAEVGEILTLTCALGEYEYRNTVDYIGIMVYSDTPVFLDLAKVRVGSNTLTEAAVAEMFADGEEAGEVQDLVTAGLVVALAAVCTVIAAVILTHHDREEDEKREAALAEASRYRRYRR